MKKIHLQLVQYFFANCVKKPKEFEEVFVQEFLIKKLNKKCEKIKLLHRYIQNEWNG